MVHTLAPDRSDQPFGKAILPRRGWCSRLVPDAHGAQSACDDGAVDPIPIANEVLRGIIPRKCLRYLTRIHSAVGFVVTLIQTRSLRSSRTMTNIEQVEVNGRGNEQVHGGKVRRVVTQKGAPSLAWWPASLDMYLATLDCATSNPSLSSSPWMRGAPHSGF